LTLNNFAAYRTAMVSETQAMKRLLVVLFVTIAAAGCQGGLFRKDTPPCSTAMVYEGSPCDEGGAYLQSPLPGP